ncbi:MAG TPA: prepilin-type N-terminal cleavage/methylation domain-containing protein [Blastocatellia bacterium]|nr:prepilin-type N-terminal cleavage/methylation domain-containing protein [Blastocatellia bacterium]
MSHEANSESGFTLIEVSIASIITMVGLLFLASLFTLALGQNRFVKQFTSTTALAQEKIEELATVEFDDRRLTVGGSLNNTVSVGDIDYFDDIYVNEETGEVQVNAPTVDGQQPLYRRFWSVENDPTLANTVIVSVRVTSLQSGLGRGPNEETSLTTIRSN